MSESLPLDDYFREAASWDADRILQSRRAVKIAWLVAAAGWCCALGGAASVAMLIPLKKVEPYVIRVDNATGIVDVVPVYAGNATQAETVTRYFLSHYVTVCERFSFATAESDYEECGAFNAPKRNQEWYAQWMPSNAASPLNVHRDGSSVRVQVQAVSFFTRAVGLTDVAQIRYVRFLAQGAGAQEKPSHWIATVRYAYTEPAKDPKTRRWNPLGFRITEFRTEPEVIAESEAASAETKTSPEESKK